MFHCECCINKDCAEENPNCLWIIDVKRCSSLLFLTPLNGWVKLKHQNPPGKGRFLRILLLAAIAVREGADDDDDDDHHDHNNDAGDDESQLHVSAAHGTLEAGRLLLENGCICGEILSAIDKILSLLLVGESLIDVILHDAGHFINLPLHVTHTSAQHKNKKQKAKKHQE